MRQNLEDFIRLIGLEILDSDTKDDYSSEGYLVVKGFDGNFVKVTFTEDSYADGDITSIKQVKGKTKTIVVYE